MPSPVLARGHRRRGKGSEQGGSFFDKLAHAKRAIPEEVDQAMRRAFQDS
jgi:hypothetical protein